ncbi:MAG: hypothetical protein IJS09_11195 [Treponema sp.]|nr:hypothetical protein [Treponema sp.]
MKKSFKFTLLSLLLAGSMATASAIDFGGMFTNDSRFSGNSFGKLILEQKDTISAWLRIPFNKQGTSYFITEGMYQAFWKNIEINGDATGEKNKYTGIVDLNLFKFYGLWKTSSGQISLSAGRFFSADLSGLVFSQTADSALLSFDFSKFTFSVYGAYTGLLNARTVSMINNIFTVSNGESSSTNEFFKEDDSKHYQRAEDYVIAAMTVSFPSLFETQTLAAQFLGAYKAKDDSYNRMYAEFSAGGPLVSTLYYNANTTFSFVNFNSGDWEIGNFSKLFLTYYASFKNMAFSVGGIYASGENGGLKSFTGFTSQTATNALKGRTEYTSLIKASAAFSIKPVTNLLLGLNSDIIFNAAESPKYEGFQYGANANWQVVSDVGLGLSMYQYFDKNDDDRNKSCVQLRAAISF